MVNRRSLFVLHGLQAVADCVEQRSTAAGPRALNLLNLLGSAMIIETEKGAKLQMATQNVFNSKEDTI